MNRCSLIIPLVWLAGCWWIVDHRPHSDRHLLLDIDVRAADGRTPVGAQLLAIQQSENGTLAWPICVADNSGRAHVFLEGIEGKSAPLTIRAHSAVVRRECDRLPAAHIRAWDVESAHYVIPDDSASARILCEPVGTPTFRWLRTTLALHTRVPHGLKPRGSAEDADELVRVRIFAFEPRQQPFSKWLEAVLVPLHDGQPMVEAALYVGSFDQGTIQLRLGKAAQPFTFQIIALERDPRYENRLARHYGPLLAQWQKEHVRQHELRGEQIDQIHNAVDYESFTSLRDLPNLYRTIATIVFPDDFTAADERVEGCLLHEKTVTAPW